jgi:hypothetical protein
MNTNVGFSVYPDKIFYVCTHVYGKAIRTLRRRQEPTPNGSLEECQAWFDDNIVIEYL